MPNPTIVLASLDDEKLKQSIANLVAHVKRATHTMLTDTNSTVDAMEKKLKSLGNLKIDSGGSADGGASKRTKAQNAETDAVEKNVAARDKQIKKNQEAATSFDNFAKAQQVAIRSANPSGMRNAEELQTMNIQLDLLRERLREARQQYSSFVALAAHATTTGDKGLFQYATDGVHRYEQEVHNLIPQIRTLQSGIQQMGDVIAPQGHTIQNYVNSLQKANPELAALNAQYKSGTSLLQGQSTSYASATQSAQRYTEEIRKQAQAIRESAEYKAGKFVKVQTPSGYDAVVHISDRVSIEDKLTQVYQQHIGQKSELNRIEQTDNEVAKERLGTETAITNEISKRKKYSTPETQVGYDVTRDKLAQIIATRNNIQRDKVVNWDEQTSSIKTLSAALKQYQEAYIKMSATERNSPFGKQMIVDMQVLERNIQKFRQQMSRPIDFESVMILPQKTLDDIAYKIRQLQSYKMGIDITKPNAQNEIKQVDEAINKLQKDMNKYMNTSKSVIEQNKALARSWNYMKNRLAFYFTVGAGTQFIKSLVEIRSEYELNERALGILIGSAERGTQIFNELSQMALVSPYTLIELSSAAKQLTAYDVAARDVVDTTRRLADMASAVGVPMERLTYALGQIKAYGYLNSRDARMFSNAGIPLVKELAGYYTELEGRLVSTADVYDRMKKKTIDYNDVMKVMYKMTDEGGKFFDFQAKMADTLKVRLANLTLAWNNLLNDMGKDSQGVLTWGIGALRTLFLHWRTLDSLIKNTASVVGLRTAFMLLAYGVLKLGGALGVTTKQMALSAVFGKRLAGVLKTVGMAMKSIVTSPLTWWSLLALAATEAAIQIFSANEATVSLNKSLREGAETNFKDISDYLTQYQKVAASLYGGKSSNAYELQSGQYKTGEISTPTDINVDEANKAWEAMRERIELSTAASDVFVGNLLEIENVSERLRQGFQLLNDIQQVNSAMRDMGDTAIVVTQDWSKWWNLWIGTDGLIENLGDVQDELDDVVKKFGSLEEARKQATGTNEAWTEVLDYDNAMRTLKGDIDETTESLNNFIRNMGFASNPDQIAEVYAQALQKISAENNLDPQRGYMLQKGFEDARGKAMKEALESRIADEAAALKLARDNETKESLKASIERNNARLELYTKYTADQRSEFERFTKYMKENHISEMQAMFGQMDEEQISHINWQEDKYLDFVKRTAAAYAKRHNMAYEDVFNRLWGLINKTNLMQIFLKLTISTEGQKSLYETLKAGDDRINQIDTEIERLKKISSLSSNYAQAQEDIVKLEKERAELKAKDAISSKEEKDAAKAAKDAARGRKSADAAARKAQREAESELQKALKDELSTIDKVRSIYKDLTKEGMSHANAVERATKGWDETVNAINRVLQKNGLQKLDLSKFAGIKNPRELLNILQSQLETLVKRGASTSEIRVLQTKIQTVSVEADKYDLTMITKGLNNELDRLKEEYELAVALDADPELGSIFANYMGINLEDLPKTAEEAAKKAQEYIDKILAENNSSEKIDISSLMDKKAFDSWVESSGHDLEDGLVKAVSAFRSYLHKVNVDETKNQAQEWNKLLEKYAEYQYKQTKIAKEANQERLAFVKKFGEPEEIASATTLVAQIETEKDSEKKEILKQQLKNLIASISEDNKLLIQVSLAIDERELREQAKLSFEEFQKTPEWILATGELSEMSYRAINTLIEKIQDYRREAKNLSPKQIKDINKALRDLYKEQRKDNPFASIGNMIDRAKDRMSVYDEEIEKVEKQIDEATFSMESFLNPDGEVDEDYLSNLIKKWQQLKKAQKEAGEIDPSDWVAAINATVKAVQAGIGVFNDLAKAIDGVDSNEADKIFSVLDKAGENAAIGAQIGGAYGAIVGAIVGAGTALVSIFATLRNEEITEQVEASERAVKRLENVYKSLEHTATNTYGAIESGAKRALRSNKELQLAQLERQLQLEESRDSKDQDEDKIIDLRGQINELRNDIKDVSKDIVNDLLGISSAGDGIEGVVSSMIDAFRNGEDVMKAFGDSFDEMVDNMILKLVVTQFMQKAWDNLLKNMENKEEQMLKQYADTQEQAQAHYDDVRNYSDEELRKIIANERYGYAYGLNYSALDKVSQEEIDAYRKAAEEALTNSTDALNNASLEYTKWSLDYMNTEGRDYLTQYATMLKDSLGQWYTYGENNTKELSALQQGLQSMSESTAESLEAYMNGVSQQVYLHSDLLTQIRDAVVSFDMDVQLGVFSQMLLQLQNNYIVMQSMQSMMENWTVPSGSGIRVELMS